MNFPSIEYFDWLLSRRRHILKNVLRISKKLFSSFKTDKFSQSIGGILQIEIGSLISLKLIENVFYNPSQNVADVGIFVSPPSTKSECPGTFPAAPQSLTDW